MSKQLEGNATDGVSIDTVLTPIDLTAICAKAAAESTGDLWNGLQRVEQLKHGRGWVHFVIRNDSAKREQLLDFTVEFGDLNGRTTLSTEVGDYRTRQKRVLGIVPTGPKKMVAHHTYRQFVSSIVTSVRAADPSALIRLREGDESVQPSAEHEIQPSVPLAQTTRQTPSVPVFVAPPTVRPPVAPTHSAVPVAPQTSQRSDPKFVPPVPNDHEVDASTSVSQLKSRSPQRWELVLPDGRALPVTGNIIFGRDPVAGDYVAPQLLGVSDDARRVSKTHAVFQVVGGRITVTDLHSSNGTMVLSASGPEEPCKPGHPVTLSEGDEVELGDYLIAIRSTIAQRY